MKHLAATLLALSAAMLQAQPTVAPSAETTGRGRGDDVSKDYNVVHSFETGYRFHTVDGNPLKYRSDVNFGNGIRLLGSNLLVNSKDGHGRLFDEIMLNTQGLGNDPYQSASFRIQHNRWYRYDLLWRSNDYFNPGLTQGTGAHLLDTRRQLQDHDFTLFPAAALRFLAGYSRNSQDGPGLSSVQVFDSLGDQFPLDANINRRQSEYRVGAEVNTTGFKFVLLRGWQRYNETSSNSLRAPSPGDNPNDRVTLNSLRRAEPYSGDTPFWRLNLLHERSNWFSVGARFSYAGTRRAFAFDESFAGTARNGSAGSRQTLFAGTGRRPVTTGTLTLSLYPSRKVTVTNHTAFHQISMDGDGAYREVNNATAAFTEFRFQQFGIRTLLNSTDITYRVARPLALFGGYHYSNRRIRSREGSFDASFADSVSAEQTNGLHTGLAGVRLQPSKPLSVIVDTEVGRADRPFFPMSDRRFHALGGRVQYKQGNLQLAVYSRARYNTNSASLFAHSARSRAHGADASWAARRGLAFDAGYSKQHLDTLTGIAYFASGLIGNESSVYVSNVHAINGGVRFSIAQRADLHLGYTRVEDTGDGRSIGATPASGTRIGSALAAFRFAQTFPLAYQSPQARLSLRIRDKLRWNLGYQFYHYKEDFLTWQNYRAHTGFTSVIWSF